VTLGPRGSYLVGRAFLPLVRETGAAAIGGLTLGADPIVTAIAMASSMDGGTQVPAFIVRKEAKEHGAGGRIAAAASLDGGDLITPGLPVALVDDAVTTAGSILQAADAVEELGCKVVLTLTIVDRQEGGGEALAARGYPFRALFKADSEGRLTRG
jgi:orotate phosphoribosyltransferase